MVEKRKQDFTPTAGPWARGVTLPEPSLHRFTLQHDVREGRLLTRFVKVEHETKDEYQYHKDASTDWKNTKEIPKERVSLHVDFELSKLCCVQTRQTQFNH